MAVFRIDKTKNYTVMANYHLRDTSLSLKAKGLLSLMLSVFFIIHRRRAAGLEHRPRRS